MLKRRHFFTGMAACASLHMQGEAGLPKPEMSFRPSASEGDHAFSVRDDSGTRIVVETPKSGVKYPYAA
jgi:hypothetical protein